MPMLASERAVALSTGCSRGDMDVTPIETPRQTRPSRHLERLAGTHHGQGLVGRVCEQLVDDRKHNPPEPLGLCGGVAVLADEGSCQVPQGQHQSLLLGAARGVPQEDSSSNHGACPDRQLRRSLLEALEGKGDTESGSFRGAAGHKPATEAQPLTALQPDRTAAINARDAARVQRTAASASPSSGCWAPMDLSRCCPASSTGRLPSWSQRSTSAIWGSRIRGRLGLNLFAPIARPWT